MLMIPVNVTIALSPSLPLSLSFSFTHSFSPASRIELKEHLISVWGKILKQRLRWRDREKREEFISNPKSYCYSFFHSFHSFSLSLSYESWSSKICAHFSLLHSSPSLSLFLLFLELHKKEG